MGNQDNLSRVERHLELDAAYSSRLRPRRLTDVESGRRLSCDYETTPLVTWRGRSVTVASGETARHGATWTIWALGCGTFVYATPLEAPPRQLVPRPVESVQVLIGVLPSLAHVNVAILEVKQDDGFNRQGRSYIVARLREKAAELGCDAIFVRGATESAGVMAVNTGVLDPDAQKLVARCIVYSRPA